TLVATAAAGMSWAVTEWVISKRPSMLGFASGVVAGLVAITPAAGFAGPVGAVVLGLIVSPICIIFCAKVKSALKYDDSLDAFGIHGVGGMIGAIATGILVSPALGGTGMVDFSKCDPSACGAYDYDMLAQVIIQLKAVGVAVVWSAIASIITFSAIKYTIGLKVDQDTEEEGLDIAEHGERAYHL
ncbi:MAG: ammonia channel protein, partial [Pseudomonadota bacterium]